MKIKLTKQQIERLLEICQKNFHSEYDIDFGNITRLINLVREIVAESIEDYKKSVLKKKTEYQKNYIKTHPETRIKRKIWEEKHRFELQEYQKRYRMSKRNNLKRLVENKEGTK